MSLHPEALKLIKSFEGYLKRLRDGTDRVKPYLCPAHVPTIGYGSIKYDNGRRVRMGDPPITRNRALELLAWEIEQICEPGVDRSVRRKLHPLMRGALISFAFNCGTGALRRSTLLKRVNAGRWEDVPKQFAKWRMGGGRVLRGLVRRRVAEAAMFMRGVEQLHNPAALVPVHQPTKKPHRSDHSQQSAPSIWARLRRFFIGG